MIEDKWSNEPIRAEIKKTGRIVFGYTDGDGHFDVFTDHNEFVRYNLSEVTDPLYPNNMIDKMVKVCEKCFWFKPRTNNAYSCSLGKHPVIADGYNPCIYLKEK